MAIFWLFNIELARVFSSDRRVRVGEGGDDLLLVDRLAELAVLALLHARLAGNARDAAGARATPEASVLGDCPGLAGLLSWNSSFSRMELP